MTRPTHIDTGQLLEVARKVFLEKGYNVSTAEIAHEAGISEGSIFRRFPTKAELFRAAMGFPTFDLQAVMEGLDQDADVRKRLETLLNALLEFQRQVIPRVIMIWSNPGLVPTQAMHPLDKAPPWRHLTALTKFLAQEAAAGRLRIDDPDVAARTIMGATHSYAFMEYMEHKAGMSTGQDDFIRRLVQLLWEGMAP